MRGPLQRGLSTPTPPPAPAPLPPPSVLSFLSAYPHPCFVLSASTLHAALITRRLRGHDSASTDPTSKSAGSPDEQDGQDVFHPRFTTTTPGGSQAPPINFAAADSILANAFAAHPSATKEETEFSAASYLSGGNQKAHDPSRTAEGAVNAMLEQKAERAAKREEERIEGVEQRKEVRRHDNESAKEPQWQQKESTEALMGGSIGKGLVGLLTPLWENDRWRELMSTIGVEPNLRLLSLLDRGDMQKMLALLVDAVEPLSIGGLRAGVGNKSSSEMPLSTRVELRFPKNSVHHREAGNGPHHSSEHMGQSSLADPNMYNVGVGSSASGSGASSVSSRAHLRMAYLDVVATLSPESDNVILTTVLQLAEDGIPNDGPDQHAVHDPDSSTRPDIHPHQHQHHGATFGGEQESSGDLSGVSSSATVVGRPSATRTSSFAPPPSATSSSGTPRVSRAPGRISLPAPSTFQLSTAWESSSSNETVQPNERYQLPAPIPLIQGLPLMTAGLDPIDFEKAFVVENHRRRRGARNSRASELAAISAEETSGSSDGTSGGGSTDDLLDIQIEPRKEEEEENVVSTSPSQTEGPVESRMPAKFQDPFTRVLCRTPMGRRIHSFPWHSTSLGPIEGWSLELRTMVSFMLASPFRSSVWYGPESVMIYNDAYASVAGNKHPGMLGKSGAEGWAELWDSLGPLAAKVMQGETISRFDDMLPMNRHGYVEETFHIWSFIPFLDTESSEILGYVNLSVETTARVIAERRLGVIRDLVVLTSLCRTLEDYCEKALHALSLNALDLPFALLYSCETPIAATTRRTTTGSDGGTKSRKTFDSTASTTAHVRFKLQGTIGVPEGHSSAPDVLSLAIDTSRMTNINSHDSDASSTASNSESQSSGATDLPSVWPFAEACLTKKPVYIGELGGRARGFENRGWPEAPKGAVCIPIPAGDKEGASLPIAMLVVGLNPRRPWDEVYATFLHLLSHQLAAGVAAVTLLQQDAQRAEELLALDRAKTNFFSNVSHELRTPLTLILGPLDDVLSGTDLRPEDRDRLSVVSRHANRLLSMVNTLLDFTKIEGARNEIIYRPVQLSAVTADLASLFRSAIEREGINFVVDCEPDPTEGRHVYLAMELWEKVIFNLVGNAFKYTWKGTITITCTYQPTSATIAISDTGCGIPQDELGAVFEKFHRIESTSRARQGTGIGLALVLELVQAHGATLDVESALGEGSTFTVTIPRGSSHLPPSQILRDVPAATPLPQRAQESLAVIGEAASWRLKDPLEQIIASRQEGITNLSCDNSSDELPLVTNDLLNVENSTVLLVDDNADLRAYVGGVLSRNYTVVVKSDGQSAFDFCLETPPAIVVSDVMMPGKLDGNGLLAALRAEPKTALIPIIFLSAQAGAEARTEALERGADDYLVKPFQSRELSARVNVHLQLGKLRVELEKRVEERTKALIESEMRYRGLAEKYSTLSLLSPIGICLFTLEGEMTYANPRWFAIAGQPISASLSSWRDNILPEDLHNLDRMWARVSDLDDDTSQPQRTELRWRSGIWTQFEIRPIEEGGVETGYVGSLTDISIVKEVEHLRIQHIEQRVAEEEESRRQTEKFVDMTCHELRNPLSGVYQNAEIVGQSLERMSSFLDDIQNGDPLDEDTLQELVVEMQENADSIGSILVCAAHQGRIADDLLLVSKLNMSLLSINPVPFDLETKLRDIIKMVEVECQQKQIDLSLVVDDSVENLNARWIVADATRLTQVILNFLTNSVKYTTGTPDASVTVHAKVSASEPPVAEHAIRVTKATPALDDPSADVCWLAISVIDSGKGLTEDEQKKLFARFSQANPKSDQYGGTGLGLYVSKKLVELHGGIIEVSSAPGEGSTFCCIIPATRSAPISPGPKKTKLLSVTHPASGSTRLRRPLSASGSLGTPGSFASHRTYSPPSSPKIGDLPAPESGQAELLRKSPLSGSSMMPALPPLASLPPPALVPGAPVHVLVVEDNLINQKVLARQLKQAGLTVTIANHGLEALDLLTAESTGDAKDVPIGVVLMDIEMPVMDGLTCIKELRRRETSGEMLVNYPCIAVTGNARSAQVELCLASGFTDVSIKPYKFNELLFKIQALTGTHSDVKEV